MIQNSAFVPEMIGVDPPLGIYSHIIGVDLVRTGENDFYVLEDNTRTPSGVSYMLENRETMMHMFPNLFAENRVAPVETYPDNLRKTLESVAPEHSEGDPVIAVLTPGLYNSAYFEHAFLADQMGVELVESVDLVVVDGYLNMKTTQGLTRVDVLYRRVDDDFLDPLELQSQVGARRAGAVRRLPRRQCHHRQCAGRGHRRRQGDLQLHSRDHRILHGPAADPEQRADLQLPQARRLKYVLEHLPELVVKEVHGSGGYGMLVGPAATKEEIETFRAKLKARPENYIAQPTLALSTCPTLVGDGIAPRHLDLRPFVLIGDEVRLVPGGLTRVALKKGSLVVNSSQGGGTKDTWVLQD